MRPTVVELHTEIDAQSRVASRYGQVGLDPLDTNIAFVKHNYYQHPSTPFDTKKISQNDAIGCPPTTTPRDPDAAIRATDTDAAHARLSAINKGYLSDPFTALLVPRARFAPPRPPLINHGTHVRARGIDALVHAWLDIGGADIKKQIVSVGAGSDSRFWRIASSARGDALKAYVELDLPENVLSKCMTIRKSKELSAVVGADAVLTHGGQALSSARYHLRPVDLRNESALDAVVDLLDPTIPTLFIAECVLAYMDRGASDRLLRKIADHFDCSAAVVYEMFGLDDAFGRVMRENLQARNVTLPGVDAYPTLTAQAERFTVNGFTASSSLTLRTIRSHYISSEERERIAKLEMLDEIEELDLVLQHYAISWGLKAPEESSFVHWTMPDQV
ncbi:leucine carboxyl methyltransferase [Auriculariales sp. MPI-PUGE-AT-0066]|nr:leucine carboxyl methyltransferase [Auriculariales sp. MPI-PUGE-AT-0066]